MNRRLAQSGRLLLLAVAIAVGATGQAVTTRTVPFNLNVLVPFASRLRSTYPLPESAVVSMVLLVVGGVLFALACRNEDWAGEFLSRLEPPFVQKRGLLVWGAFMLGATSLATVLFVLSSNHYGHWLVGLFLVALALLATPFLPNFGALQLRPHFNRIVFVQTTLLFALVATFVIVGTHDLDHWRFSALGDEYAFYEFAEGIAGGAPFNVFSQEGVYGYHPVFSSAYQALFLKLSAGDIFAWKLSSVVVVACTLVPFYLLVKELFTWRAALFATCIMATSHYLLAITHTGYNNIDSIFPAVLALWLLAVGLRRGSTFALFAAGVAAGLGFYTFYSARSTIVIIAFVLLASGRRALRVETILPIAIGFAAFVAPIFTLHGTDVFTKMVDQSAAGFESSATGPRIERFASNIVPSIMAFNINPDREKFVSGSLLDPLSATLFVLGLWFALARFRRPAFRLLLIWWLVALAITGFSYPKPGVAITRLYFVLPPAAAMAGAALEAALNVSVAGWRLQSARLAAFSITLTVVFAVMLYVNLHRFWDESNRGAQVSAVAAGAYLSGLCEDQPTNIMTQTRSVLLPEILHAYRLGKRTPMISTYTWPLAPGRPARSGNWDGCIIIVPPRNVNFDLVVRRFSRLFGDKEAKIFGDRYAINRVLVLRERSTKAAP